MKEVDIKLSSVNTINSFLNTISRLDDRLFIKSGCHMVNAASPIGIFTCDLSRPVKLMILSNEEKILPALERYIAR